MTIKSYKTYLPYRERGEELNLLLTLENFMTSLEKYELNFRKYCPIMGLDRYIELNKIPMIISSPGLRNLNESNKSNQDALLYTWNDRFCSAYDIIPTLFDLLGISFNENMYIGHSLFRENDPDLIYEVDGGYRDMIVYYSNTGGVYSENIYSINIRDYKFEGIEESDELIEMFDRETTNIVTKICYINLISVYCLYDEVQLR